ncbi:NAD(P)(+) transhydrogenase (Re/Si-specific) subunit beta [Massilia litorea]|uniref:NAD(P)(+) transhydrogenase (Re/Si-specific) subunit beta n=1 Tax=Massilia litorea TaxID=2769491 RepID=A0A7L9U7U2_9BURK|nr:NAD(P)(+) transhydrogenase (Re/Si-specific) subunit beta [Massilia litorea]QOL51121.1 NAD(P)(+) transhydrogenase (Re/Si-specific) subunit beta [Massilia litorea]
MPHRVGSRAHPTLLDNDLFYMPNTMMVFGDAKKVIESMVKAVE